jgi:hypothetical protein
MFNSEPKSNSLFIHVDDKTWSAILDFENLLESEQNHALKDDWKKLLDYLGEYVIFIDAPPNLIDDDPAGPASDDGAGFGSHHRP